MYRSRVVLTNLENFVGCANVKNGSRVRSRDSSKLPFKMFTEPMAGDYLIAAVGPTGCH